MPWEKLEKVEQDVVMPAYVLVVDELASFIGTNNREERQLSDKFLDNLERVAALGRSSHTHLILSSQSPTGDIFGTKLKANVMTRICAGRVEGNISRMAFDSEEGTAIPLATGSCLGYIKSETCNYQGYYTPLEQVLSMGTIREGYNPKTGTRLDDEDVVKVAPKLIEGEEETEKTEDEEKSTELEPLSIDISDDEDDFEDEEEDLEESSDSDLDKFIEDTKPKKTTFKINKETVTSKRTLGSNLTVRK